MSQSEADRATLERLGLDQGDIMRIIAERREQQQPKPREAPTFDPGTPERSEMMPPAVPCMCCHESGVAFYNGLWVCLRCTFAYCGSCKRCLACCEHESGIYDVRTPA
jgi:hypothetical protein